MNYYKRHIGDYIKDASHLSLLEHGVYTRLLDVYYGREGPIPEADAARLIGARSKEERAAVQSVLAEFFALDGDSWRRERCDAEIVEARENGEENAAKKENERERQRRHRERRKVLFEQLRENGIVPKWDTSTEQLETLLSHDEQRTGDAPVTRTATAIHKPIANSHKPVSKSIDAALALLVGVDDQIAADWVALRKSKRAPITATAIDGIRAEALKAGLSLQDALAMCCQRGWTGFKAEWAAGQRAPPRPEWDGKSAKQREAETFVRELTGNGSATESGRTVAERVDRAPVLAISDGLRHRKNE